MKKLLSLIAFLPFTCSAFSVGIVSDMHVGKLSKRKSGNSIVYPKQALKYFERSVQEMKSKDVELIISLGDTTQAGGSKYYKKLKKIENKYGVKVLWIRGNHDDKNFSILGPDEYVYGYKGIRFVVLNTSNCPKSFGSSGCFNGNLPDGDIYLQHHPPLIPGTCDWRGDFKDEMNLTIWSGHFHGEMECQGVRVFPALTEHKRLNYKIIEL